MAEVKIKLESTVQSWSKVKRLFLSCHFWYVVITECKLMRV